MLICLLHDTLHCYIYIDLLMWEPAPMMHYTLCSSAVHQQKLYIYYSQSGSTDTLVAIERYGDRAVILLSEESLHTGRGAWSQSTFNTHGVCCHDVDKTCMIDTSSTYLRPLGESRRDDIVDAMRTSTDVCATCFWTLEGLDIRTLPDLNPDHPKTYQDLRK